MISYIFSPEPVLFRKLDTLFYVRENDEAAHAGRQVLVGVLEVPPVLYEIVGHLQFSHVVVVGGHPRQDGVGPDALRGSPREIAHEYAVMVRAGGLDHQLLEEGVLQVRKLEELEVCRIVENVLYDGKEACGHETARQAAEEDKCGLQGHLAQGMAEEAMEEKHDKGHDEGGKEAGPEHGRALLHLSGKVGGQEVAEKGVHENGEAVVHHKRHRYREDRRKDENGLGEENYAHHDAEKEQREHVKEHRGIIRDKAVEDQEGDLYEKDRKDGQGSGEDEVFLRQVEFFDILVRELENNGDQREEYEEEVDCLAGNGLPVSLHLPHGGELLADRRGLPSGLP